MNPFFNLIRQQLQEMGRAARSIRGNSRTCVLVEPMWGIPFHLYTTYASLYMLALGCTETQIGLVTSIGLVLQMLFALFGGHVTDRLGRRRTTLIFDLISWTIPTLIWAAARNFKYFLVAAAINSLVRIVHTSWTCLLIEDSEPKSRVHVYSGIYIAGLLAGFFAPLAGFLVQEFSLVPAVRGLYLFAFVSMTGMFLIRNRLTVETEIGKTRMKEVRSFRYRDVMAEYKQIIRGLVRNPYLVGALMLVILNNIHMTIKWTFLSILLSEGLGFTKVSIAIFPAVHSVVMLLVFLFVMPTLSGTSPQKSLFWGLITSAAGYLLLFAAPLGGYFFVVLSTILTAFGTAVVFPIADSLLANAIKDQDRAKVLSIFHSLMLGLSAPFGFIGGLLSTVSDRLPFVLVFILQITSLLLVGGLARWEKAR